MYADDPYIFKLGGGDRHGEQSLAVGLAGGLLLLRAKKVDAGIGDGSALAPVDGEGQHLSVGVLDDQSTIADDQHGIGALGTVDGLDDVDALVEVFDGDVLALAIEFMRHLLPPAGAQL